MNCHENFIQLSDKHSKLSARILSSHHENLINLSETLSLSANNNEEKNQENVLRLVRSENNRMQVALGVLIRFLVPVFNRVAKGWQGIRGINILQLFKHLRNSRQMLTNLLAYAANTISLSLSSVQVVHKIDPLLKIIKLKKPIKPNIITNNIPTTSNILRNFEEFLEDVPEKCVQLNILVEPPIDTPIRADIIFIHGLHGSLVNTWKQGLWNSKARSVNFQRSPKPRIRPPKRSRHSRTTQFCPPHQSKRRRFNVNNHNISTDSMDTNNDIDDKPKRQRTLSLDECSYFNNNFSNDCNNDTIEFVEDFEYSFPIYRLCINNGIENKFKNDVPDFKNNNISKNENDDDDHTNNMTVNNTIFSKCWPRDWLPLDCPGVRVMAINYTTDPYLWRPIWVKKRNRTSLTERSREMTDLLIEKSVGVGHPIIWVGHSKGGIFIKQMIVDAFESGKTSTESLWRSSRGILFYSVPHRGSSLADFNLPLLRQSIELTEIKKNSSALLELHRRFVSLYMSGKLNIQIFSFIETALTFMSVIYLRIVGIDSADPGIGEVCAVHLDHREICKPSNRNCILYTELTNMINKVDITF